jgi:hypothetical protein
VIRVRAAALLTVLLVALTVAGCGGDDSIAPQAPGPPADAPVLESPDAPPGGGDDNADQGENTDEGSDTGSAEPTAEPAPEATAEPAPDSGTGEVAPAPDDTAAVPEEEGGGATAPEGETDGPANDTAPPAGSEAEQFEDFCAQNPGAC